ncbi:Na-H-Exchanger domain-containing protein [Fusarium keratoplasticum]|uniref:Na-H-Exchanger domain-containing protein n=1 Tax=Fusarium keratoplasticum TaxID=1328300 RepID=A0ACC0RJ22_9HYPO|nr:Na-H-Exchanger domain-containing protein [Fusarium keratoplasticum]KAI8685094.1 Na-H-Exchanger domain-containing protein [Fusarium keratoplasticum]
MPTLDVSELNIVLAVLVRGAFVVLYGIISVKIRQSWYLGIALPAVVVGIILGPVAAKFIEADKWGAGHEGQTRSITLGVTRVMIGLQLVMAGYQLPARYCLTRWREMALCLLPIMTMMWICTTLCVIATVPKVTVLSALVIASCVACTDPVLSQAIAKGPFADKFVARPLREIISAEAGANDGFGFPFLMLAVYIMRCTGGGRVEERANDTEVLLSRTKESDMGIGVALKEWFLETWLYTMILSVVYGIAVGYLSRKSIDFCLKRKWIDNESFLLLPTAIGLFIVGTCGAIGTDDSLACFVAGCALNWDGHYLTESQRRYDEVNTSIQMLLNFGGFFYIGTVLPWSAFQDPGGTGLTYDRLFCLGFMVLFLRRIPAMLVAYKLMPKVCKNYKEALFMGYFGPIGAGAVFYIEYAREVLPEFGEGNTEETDLVLAIGPVVYWLVLFSIVVHGLSIPALDAIYTFCGVKPIHDDAVEIRRCSRLSATPVNGTPLGRDSFLLFNRFSRPVMEEEGLPVIEAASTRGSSADDQGVTDSDTERKSSDSRNSMMEHRAL